MTSKEQMDLRLEQINSLKWAIKELKKEKTTIANRFEKTKQAKGLKDSLSNALNEKSSLQDRIEDLQGNLRQLGEEEYNSSLEDKLENQKASLEERIAIASERLTALEQDRDLERIARRFQGSEMDGDQPTDSSISLSKESITTDKSMEESTSENRLKHSSPLEEADIDSLAPIRELKPKAKPLASSGDLACSGETCEQLLVTSAALDLDPEYLLNKSLQAVLRMIERNKNRVTFPLEVKQVDSID
tara:strand:- start:4593 stop:5330 length:738 start_codon:yes stop_codon:yes gene_type:complete